MVQQPIPVAVPVKIEKPSQQRRQVQLQPQRKVVPAKQVVLRRSKSYPDNLSQEKVKPKWKRPLSWTSPSVPIRKDDARPPVRVDLKIPRVYDAIAPPTSKAKTVQDSSLEYNKLSYMGYPKRKPPYPCHDSFALASMYSRLNADKNSPHTATSKMAIPMVGAVDEKNGMGNLLQVTASQRAKKVDGRVQKEFPMSPYSEEASPSPLYSNVTKEVNACSTKSLVTPVYSIPDMKKKKEGRQVKDIPPWNISPPSSPVYSNMNAERNKACGLSSHPGPVYSIPDMEKKWESRQMKSQQGHKGQREAVEQTIQMRALPPRHQTVSLISSPLYSNLDDQRGLVESTPVPVYSVPAMGMDGEPHQATSKLGTMKKDYPMKELPPQHETSLLYSNANAELSSSALYSNVNAEMHPVRITSSQKSTPVYSVPDKNKKARNRQEKKDQDNGCSQLPLYSGTSPSPPPLPLPMITESTGERLTTFDASEPLYPHVSVPFRLMTVKPMPSDTSHVYDCPKRKDVYKPLPLEGFYDVPSSNPKKEFSDVTGSHYDLPKSLSLAASSKSTETGLKSGIEDEDLERLEQSSRWRK